MTVMVYLVEDLFNDCKKWVKVNMTTMTIDGFIEPSSYKAVSGRVFKVNDDMSVVDDTDAWERSKAL